MLAARGRDGCEVDFPADVDFTNTFFGWIVPLWVSRMKLSFESLENAVLSARRDPVLRLAKCMR